MNRLADKVALITGAGRGIGRGIARAFAAEGCSLVLTARSETDLKETAQEARQKIPESADARIETLAGDVADPAAADRAFAIVQEKFGRLDLLVNNAGAFDGGPLDELPLETWDRVIATNLRGPFLYTQRSLRMMKTQGGGRIINIGSISAQRVRPNSAPYSTSKHGLWGLTQSTALEGRAYGVTCCCLHPGNVRTERRTGSGKLEDEEPMMSVDEVAEVVLLIAALPPHVEMLSTIVLPRDQQYVGRG